MKNLLTIVIPAKKEEEAILNTLEEIKKKVKTPHKIIVVNDSFDGDRTGDIVKKYVKNKNISVIINRTNPHPTFASALILGFDSVKEGVVIPVMADLCDRIEDIDVMYEKIHNGWDIVCGSRYGKDGSKKGGPVIQSICSFLVCTSLHYLAGIPTKDISNAFKMYRKRIFDKITIDPASGVEISISIVLQAFLNEVNITDIPTKWTDRTMGLSKFKLIERAPRYFKLYISVLLNVFKHKILKKLTKKI